MCSALYLGGLVGTGIESDRIGWNEIGCVRYHDKPERNTKAIKIHRFGIGHVTNEREVVLNDVQNCVLITSKVTETQDSKIPKSV